MNLFFANDAEVLRHWLQTLTLALASSTATPDYIRGQINAYSAVAHLAGLITDTAPCCQPAELLRRLAVQP